MCAYVENMIAFLFSTFTSENAHKYNQPIRVYIVHSFVIKDDLFAYYRTYKSAHTRSLYL